jgi:hypothetical protein
VESFAQDTPQVYLIVSSICGVLLVASLTRVRGDHFTGCGPKKDKYSFGIRIKNQEEEILILM